MTPMPQSPTAAQLFLAGFSRIVDAAGVVLLVVLGYRMFFVFESSLQTRALAVGVLGTAACWMDRRAARDVPAALLGFVAVGLLSAAVNRWPIVSAGADPEWLSLFSTASHLVAMAAFVYGGAYLLRTPRRLSILVVLLVVSISVLAVEIAFDRASVAFVYQRVGGSSMQSVPHWGGIHGTGLILTLGLPLALAVAFAGQSRWRVVAAVVLGAGFLLAAVLNGARGSIVAMVLSAILMTSAGTVASLRQHRHARLLTSAALVMLAGLTVALWWNRASFNMNDLSGRGLIWEPTIRLALDHWWIGVGPGNFSNAMFETHYADRYLALNVYRFYNAHNLFLHAFAEVGVFGVLFLIGLLGVALRSCWQAWTAGYLPIVSLGLLFSVVGFLWHSLTENFLDARVEVERTRLMVWMILAAALALARLSRRVAAGER